MSRQIVKPTLVSPLLIVGIAALLNGCASNELELAPPGTQASRNFTLPRPVPYVTQSTPETCWLACAAMVCQYNGQYVTEQQLRKSVEEITMDIHSRTLKATKRECLIALSQRPGWHEEFAKAFHHILTSSNSHTQIAVDPGQLLLDSLASRTCTYGQLLGALVLDKQPAVIVCAVGPWTDEEHAMVVTGAQLGVIGSSINNGNQSDNYGIVSLSVLDPADPSGEVLTKSSEYLKANLKAIYTKELAERLLENEIRDIRIQYN